MTAQTVLVAALALNAALGFGYRVYRLTKGGPITDVWGQAVLAVFLGAVTLLVALDWGPARWIALGYALLFGLLVMPVWVLAVLIPQQPEKPDYAYTGAYWALLGVVGIAAVLA